MSTDDASDHDETTPRPRIGEKYAVYRDVDGYGWLMDTCAGGTWSWDIDDAQWFDRPDDAIGALYACDLVEMGVDFTEARFAIIRVK